MAIGTPYTVAADTALTTSSTDASFTTNAIAHSGDTLFIWCATRLTTTAVISTVSGPTGGTPEILSHKHASVSSAVSIYRIHLTSDLASGSSVTVTLDGSSSRKVVGAFAVPGLADANADKTTSSDGTTGTPSTGTTAATTQAAEIAIAAFQHNAVASTDTGLPGGSYTEIGDKGVGSSSQSQGYAEYLILAATGTQSATFTPSGTTSTAYNGVIGTWKASGGLTSVTPSDTALSSFSDAASLLTNRRLTDMAIARPVGNTFEGGTNSVAFTTSDTSQSGDTFDNVGDSSGIYDSSVTFTGHGSLTGKFSGAASHAGYSHGYNPREGSGRLYFRIATIPGSGNTNLVSATSGGWAIAIDTNGHLIVKDATGAAQSTSTTVISTNTPYRLEWQWSRTAQTIARIYSSIESTGSPTETLTAAANTNGANMTAIIFGTGTTDTVSIDDPLVGPGTWLGPTATTPFIPNDSVVRSPVQRALSDTGLTASDTAAAAALRALTASDAALSSFSDTTAILLGKNRAVTDTALTFSDSVKRNPIGRVVSDTASVSDSVARLAKHPVSDTALTTSDTLALKLARAAAPTDTALSFSESAAALKGHHGSATPSDTAITSPTGVSDSFTRTNASDWDGSWVSSGLAGTGWTFTEDGAHGIATPTTANQSQGRLLGDNQTAGDWYTTINWASTATGGPQDGGIILFFQSTSAYLRVQVHQSAGGAILNRIESSLATGTNLGTDYDLTTISIDVTKPIRIHVNVAGTTISSNMWQAGNAEPPGYQNVGTIRAGTDPQSGQSGVRVLAGNGNTNLSAVTFDNYSTPGVFDTVARVKSTLALTSVTPSDTALSSFSDAVHRVKFAIPTDTALTLSDVVARAVINRKLVDAAIPAFSDRADVAFQGTSSFDPAQYGIDLNALRLALAKGQVHGHLPIIRLPT